MYISFGNRWAIKNIMQPAIMPKFSVALMFSLAEIEAKNGRQSYWLLESPEID